MAKTAALLIALITLSSASAADFTGDYKVTTSSRGSEGHTINGRVLSKPSAKKMRMDVTMPGLGNASNILDGTARKAFAVMHSRRMIMEMDMSRWERENNGQCMNVNEVAQCLTRIGYARTGSETVNGYDCDVYTKTETRDGAATTTKFYHPRNRGDAPLTRMLVTRPGNTMQMDITNIVYATVADSEFALPAGYTRQDASAFVGSAIAGGEGGKAPMSREEIQRMIQEQMSKSGGRRPRH